MLILIFSLLLTQVYSIKDGAPVDECSYPGLCVVLAPNDAIICNGVKIGGLLSVPELCGSGMNNFLDNNDLTVICGESTTNFTLTQGTKGAVSDGVYTFDTSTFTGGCNGDAVVYDGLSDIDKTSCEVVGYGADTQSSKTYDGVAQVTSVLASTSSPCCDVILDNLTQDQKGVIIDRTAEFNCVTANGATCGTGDLGAPVYCNTTAGTTVVIGLTSSSPCTSGGRFLVHDLTHGSTKIKF
ncbi:uncharacterized protein LOC131934601 [Physella acuta]|uniref:uncharacterized protein LOC131934601 n=1 Tax=Physella acuta TaxID=109671 RepID=UPI0027DDBA5F|nr:uncharacterized protein LOC131934601 [Physella acuta]